MEALEINIKISVDDNERHITRVMPLCSIAYISVYDHEENNRPLPPDCRRIHIEGNPSYAALRGYMTAEEAERLLSKYLEKLKAQTFYEAFGQRGHQ